KLFTLESLMKRMEEMKPELPFSAETLVQWDKQHLWHPFTHMQPYLESEPVLIWRGEGVKLQDIQGRWYYDGVASIWLNVHGHHVPAIDQAIQVQLERVAHATLLGQGTLPAILLARRLVEMTPSGLNRVFYSDSGATAVEIALKLAVQYWANQGRPEKHLILGFTNGYHGDTLGAMSVAPDDIFHWPFKALLPPQPQALYPDCYRCPLKLRYPECQLACLDAVSDKLRAESEQIAAVIIEPVQGAGGIIPAPPGYLQALREVCDRYEVLLILDEVATGFGRTGPLFACQAEGVTPDLLCLGKGLTGGYFPLAATLATEKIFSAFLGRIEERKTFYHGHSFTGNPVGCAAALASLELLEVLLPMLPEKIALIAEQLAPLRAHPFVGDVRQAGLMIGIELVSERESRRSFPREAQAGWTVARAARRRGMLIRPIGSVVIFMPPLASTLEELREMTQILCDAFADATPELESLHAEKEPAP